ncbi:DUF4287 domain-containing protein [Alteromonas sediminis]|uniref:DUF4287 domain-containing protein n=1 Tax=Alteromonas sediminis TaxID=2259342 RepID=A0A3N5XXF9_9ALTE|nr:DUF5655 domain-containing protein [Alteromonas sediminis]RPJ65123.1 DUF4287 domain-containing protein [Alteromonas sediminis]
MSIVDKALATQLKNIEAKTHKSIEELVEEVVSLGELKHKQKVDHLKVSLSIGYGDANTLVHYAKKVKEDKEPSTNSVNDPLDNLYINKKAHLRPIHELLDAKLESFGGYEIAPKKTYISYRRKKQFCMIGPATNSRVELGLNIPSLPDDERLIPQPKGKMCHFIIRLTSPSDVDDILIDFIQQAYNASG